MAFQIGDRVAFQSDDRTVEGMVTRVNEKIVTIEGDDGLCWRLSPGVLSKAVAPAPTAKKRSNVFTLLK